MRTFLLAISLAASFALPGCDSAESARIDETRAKLAGTWLLESEAEGGKLRRVLVLGSDGSFKDQVLVVRAGAASDRIEYEGEWSYDGVHLKRRFLRENGRQYSGGGMRFATFPLVSLSEREMIVDDNIRGEKANYRRVANGTQL